MSIFIYLDIAITIDMATKEDLPLLGGRKCLPQNQIIRGVNNTIDNIFKYCF